MEAAASPTKPLGGFESESVELTNPARAAPRPGRFRLQSGRRPGRCLCMGPGGKNATHDELRYYNKRAANYNREGLRQEVRGILSGLAVKNRLWAFSGVLCPESMAKIAIAMRYTHLPRGLITTKT